MKFVLPTALLATLLVASTIVTTDEAFARERNYSQSTHWDELRQRARYSYHYASEQPTPVIEETTTEEPADNEVTAPVIVTSDSANTAEDNTPESYLETVQREIHRLTNLERQKVGLPTLLFDEELAAVAEGHSKDMVARDYFAHTSPDGCNMGCRLDAADYEFWYWGENIAWRRQTPLPSATGLAEHFVDAWMNSSGHKANILSENYTHEGIGLAQTGNTVFVTSSFADPQ